MKKMTFPVCTLVNTPPRTSNVYESRKPRPQVASSANRRVVVVSSAALFSRPARNVLCEAMSVPETAGCWSHRPRVTARGLIAQVMMVQ